MKENLVAKHELHSMAFIICQYLRHSRQFFTPLTVRLHTSPLARNLVLPTPGVEKDLEDESFEFGGFNFLLVLIMVRI